MPPQALNDNFHYFAVHSEGKSVVLRTYDELNLHYWLNLMQLQKVKLEETIDTITL